MKVEYICNVCGGNSVTRDAWAKWDTAAQDWTLSATFDYAYCHNCEDETRLEENELDSEAESEHS
jgi:hypothetical protein